METTSNIVDEQPQEPEHFNPWMSGEYAEYYGYSPPHLPQHIPRGPDYVSLKQRTFVGCSSPESYSFGRKLGEGTFGEVYEGVHIVTQTAVALKKILLHNADDGMPITALREIKILKALKHENLLSLFDMVLKRGDKDGKRAEIHMVTPYMDHDLSGLIDNPQITFSPAQIKCYLRQLLEGVKYLHEKEILHRDLKVANLLVNNKGILKIADFGLSRYKLGSEELTNCVVTRWYRPPEILLGAKNYSYPIDLWGVGCVFAQMLTSEPLIPGKNDIEQLNLIFDLCGAPTEETMPGWRNLPVADVVDPGHATRSRIRERFREYDIHAVDLLEKFLTLDPSKRITAKDALEHPYFTSYPLPAHPSCIPRYPSSHELDNFGPRGERRRQPLQPQRPVDRASPPSYANGPSRQQNYPPDSHSYGHQYHRPSGRRPSRERGPRGSDHRNSQRGHPYKEGNRYRNGGGQNRHRR